MQANTTAQQVNATSLKPHVPLSNTIKPVPCVAPPTMVVPLHIERKPCAPPSAGLPLYLQRSGFDKQDIPQDRKLKSILSTVQGSKFGNSRTDHNEIPDLLSGFDKHAASLSEQKDKYVSISIPTEQTSSDKAVHVQASEHPLFVGPIGESPYITSKSFDDLHQCLANNQIPHLDLSAGHSKPKQDELKMSLPIPPVACGVPIQVSTNNYTGAFHPYTNQQNNSQPMHMVSFMPQLQTQMTNQSSPVLQDQNTSSAIPLMQTSRNDVAEVAPRKTFGALSVYNQNGTHLPFSNHAVDNPILVGGQGGTNKRSHIESGPSFNSLFNDGSKRFKSSHAVSTTSGSSEPSSSDGGFDNELGLSSYDNSSASFKTHSKQVSNNSDSSETD